MSESLMSWAKEVKNKKYVILIMLVLLACIFLSFYPFGDKSNKQVPVVVKSENSRNNQSENYEDKLERKLAGILTRMEGVGAVDVMVTTISTEEKVIAQNENNSNQQTEEKDQSGGNRVTTQSQNHTDVVLQSGNVPYVTKENAPEIKGVFILAEGADNSEVKAQIIEAVSRLLDVPVHKISVEKKKN